MTAAIPQVPVPTANTEYRWRSHSVVEGRWENFDDNVFNDVWRELEKIKPTRDDHLHKTVNSGFVKDFNPFADYLGSLPPWDGDDYIRGMAVGVSVAGGFGEWMRPFYYAGIYAQAYYLYRNGFAYWFSADETAAINRGNSRFTVANLERQMVYRYYRRPAGADPGEFVSVGDAMQQMAGSIVQKLRKEAVDQAFIDLGFEPMVADGIPGYRAVRRKPEEINVLGRQMADRADRGAEPEEQDSGVPDHF